MTHYVTGVPAAETVQTSKEAEQHEIVLADQAFKLKADSESEYQNKLDVINRELEKMEYQRDLLHDAENERLDQVD